MKDDIKNPLLAVSLIINCALGVTLYTLNKYTDDVEIFAQRAADENDETLLKLNEERKHYQVRVQQIEIDKDFIIEKADKQIANIEGLLKENNENLKICRGTVHLLLELLERKNE